MSGTHTWQALHDLTQHEVDLLDGLARKLPSVPGSDRARIVDQLENLLWPTVLTERTTFPTYDYFEVDAADPKDQVLNRPASQQGYGTDRIQDTQRPGSRGLARSVAPSNAPQRRPTRPQTAGPTFSLKKNSPKVSNTSLSKTMPVQSVPPKDAYVPYNARPNIPIPATIPPGQRGVRLSQGHPKLPTHFQDIPSPESLRGKSPQSPEVYRYLASQYVQKQREQALRRAPIQPSPNAPDFARDNIFSTMGRGFGKDVPLWQRERAELRTRILSERFGDRYVLPRAALRTMSAPRSHTATTISPARSSHTVVSFDPATKESAACAHEAMMES